MRKVLDFRLLDRVEVHGNGSSRFTDGHIETRLVRLREEPPANLSAKQVAEEICYLEGLRAKRRG